MTVMCSIHRAVRHNNKIMMTHPTSPVLKWDESNIPFDIEEPKHWKDWLKKKRGNFVKIANAKDEKDLQENFRVKIYSSYFFRVLYPGARDTGEIKLRDGVFP